MSKKRLVITAMVVALLFVSAIVGMMAYYNGKIANLNSQISRLNAMIADFPTAQLTSSLGIREIPGNESNSMGAPTPIPYNYLFVTGQVSNTGKGVALKVGLHFVAYDAEGMLLVNLTVPLNGGIYGTDNSTNTFVSRHYGNSSLTLGVLDSGQVEYVNISILHEGIATTWSATPVWANTQ